MFLDLNCFKRVNDEHGHAIGDAVLQEVGRRLQGMTRADDTISRHGGDEFLCLLIETGAEQDLVQIAEKFIREVQLPCDLGESSPEVSLNMSVSIGIFRFSERRRHSGRADRECRRGDVSGEKRRIWLRVRKRFTTVAGVVRSH